MDPILPNALSQGAATAADRRPIETAGTSEYQTPDRQPLNAPPMPLTGHSQIAAVVRGLLASDAADVAKTARAADAEPKDAERILKPYGISMLPESAAETDAKDDDVGRDTGSVSAQPSEPREGSTATAKDDGTTETDALATSQPAPKAESLAAEPAASVSRTQE